MSLSRSTQCALQCTNLANNPSSLGALNMSTTVSATNSASEIQTVTSVKNSTHSPNLVGHSPQRERLEPNNTRSLKCPRCAYPLRYLLPTLPKRALAAVPKLQVPRARLALGRHERLRRWRAVILDRAFPTNDLPPPLLTWRLPTNALALNIYQKKHFLPHTPLRNVHLFNASANQQNAVRFKANSRSTYTK